MQKTTVPALWASAVVAIASIGNPSPLLADPPFVDITVQSGVAVESNSMWGAGVAFLDCDNDTDIDIFVVDGEGDPHVLFRNDGGQNFTEIANDAGLADDSWGKAAVPADIDNDGDPDLVVTAYVGDMNRLYRNDAGSFVDITAGSGFDYDAACTGAAWADYDRDGLLDCYITTYNGARNRLLHNLGGGVFEEVAQALGVDDQGGWGYQPAWFDYDNDGLVDLYVGNDDFFGGDENALFRNQGDGTFQDVGALTGADISIETMGIAVGDYDNDLDLDLYLTNLPEGNVLLRNDDGFFTDATEDAGVGVYNICWGTDWLDYDNDGWLDLYVDVFGENGNPRRNEHDGDTVGGVPDEAHRGDGGYFNRLYRGIGNGNFEDISSTSGVDNPGVSYCSAVSDFDEDGDLDLYVTNFWFTVGDTTSAFYENVLYTDVAGGSDYLRVNLIGTISNRDAIGARVWIETSEGGQVREKQAGTSYLSSSEPTMHFGLGGATNVDRLIVRWPSGLAEEYMNVPAGSVLTLIEGDGVPSSVETDESPLGGPVSIAPNPTFDRTEIKLRIGGASKSSASVEGRLGIHDAQGRLIRSIPVEANEGTVLSVEWDRRDDAGRTVPSGSYFVRMAAGDRAFDGGRIVVLD